MYDNTMLVASARSLLVDAGGVAEFDIAGRHTAWVESHPNTYGVVTDTGVARGETMKQLHARAIGAHIASELQIAA